MVKVPPEGRGSSSGSLFPLTHWSLILRAGDIASPSHQQARTQFCETYWKPVYFFIRARGRQPADAEDLTQEFFARFLEQEILAGLTRKGSRFRAYLQKVLQNFLMNQHRKQCTQKRGGRVQFMHIDADTEVRYLKQLTVQISPETLFDREYALAVLERVRTGLREDYARTGRGQVFELLEGYLPGARETLSYEAAAQALGMKVTAVREAVQRIRQRYGKLLRAEVAVAGTSPKEIDDEIRYLITIMSGP